MLHTSLYNIHIIVNFTREYYIVYYIRVPGEMESPSSPAEALPEQGIGQSEGVQACENIRC